MGVGGLSAVKKERTLKRTRVFGEYGMKRLSDCASSFQDLAKSFVNIPGDFDSGEDRTTRLLCRRLRENRTLLAEHLYEMADIMTEVAEESVNGVRISERVRHHVERELAAQGVELISMTMLQNRARRYKLIVTMKTEESSLLTTEEIGDLLSTQFDRRFVPAKGSVSLLNSVEECVIYEEEARYHVMTGVARATKEGETKSGDNFTIKQVENGGLYLAISDGAGSGNQACLASQTVIELMEKFIEAGFSTEMAIQMINGVLLAADEEQNLSTLDICHIDLHTGECEFVKVGAANSYIKSEGMVEVVLSNTLPLGVFYRVEIQNTKSQLVNGDYVILLSDGVFDCFEELSFFEEMLTGLQYEGPKEIANLILSYAIHQSKGVIRDDMTIIILGIWDNTLTE